MSSREEVVPIVRVNSADVERLIQRLSEVVKEVRASGRIKEDDVSLTIELTDVFTELVSRTASDIIVSPHVAEQIMIIDSLLTVSLADEALLKPFIDAFLSKLNNGDSEGALAELANYIHMDRICFNSIIQVLKKRITHVYVNMPPAIRPSLTSAFVGYEKVE